MKATEQYFLEVLFISMYFTVVRFISCAKLFLLLRLWMKRWRITVQIKATEQYFPVMWSCLFRCTKTVLTSEFVRFVDEIFKSDNSNVTYRAVLSHGTVYYAVWKVALTIGCVDEIHSEQSFLWHCLILSWTKHL